MTAVPAARIKLPDVITPVKRFDPLGSRKVFCLDTVWVAGYFGPVFDRMAVLVSDPEKSPPNNFLSVL